MFPNAALSMTSTYREATRLEQTSAEFFSIAAPRQRRLRAVEELDAGSTSLFDDDGWLRH